MNDKERKELIENHIALAKSIAKKHRHFETSDRPDYEERVSEAYLGLVEAARTYDPGIGAFSTYATKVIKSHLIKADRRAVFPVKVSDNSHKILRDMRRAVNNGVKEEPEAIAKAIHVSENKIKELWQYYKKAVRQENTKDSEDEMDAPETKIPDKQNVADEVEDKILGEEVAKAIKQLDPIEQKVIRKRFGFDDGEAKLSKEIAAMLEIKKETLIQVEESAIKKLEKILENQRNKPIL